MTAFNGRQFMQNSALGAITAALPGCSMAASTPVKPPNIIIYLVDDLGWNHISAAKATMGTHKKFYHTPNIEKLAKNGVSFTHAYQQPNCAPTRAAILTGQYPARIHNDVYVVGNLNRSKKSGLRFTGPAQSEDVAADAITIAEAMKQNGYVTAHIGKYHVGGRRGDETLPENVGFDINIGGCYQGHQPTCFASEKDGNWDFEGVGRGDFARYAAPYTKAYVEKHNFPESLIGQSKHISDALGDAFEDTIAKLRKEDKPFYLQFHTYAVHAPVRARPDLKAEAARRSNGTLPEPLQEYAGFVASVDLNLGRMLAALHDPNGDGDASDSIAANTVILFTSDNGGTADDHPPLKGKKGMFTEGGIRVPAIACWPGVIPPDTVTDFPIHSVDFYPTCLELAGNKWLPPKNEHPLDGYSFADILRKPDANRVREPIFYLFPGYLDNRAQPCVVAIDDVGSKRYKLFYYYEPDSWELYCLTDDQGETRNLIDSHPEIASTLSRKIHNWLNQKHPTWKPKYPIEKVSGKPLPPPEFGSEMS